MQHFNPSFMLGSPTFWAAPRDAGFEIVREVWFIGRDGDKDADISGTGLVFATKAQADAAAARLSAGLPASSAMLEAA